MLTPPLIGLSPLHLALQDRPTPARTYVPSNNMTPGKSPTPDDMATPSTMGDTKVSLEACLRPGSHHATS